MKKNLALMGLSLAALVMAGCNGSTPAASSTPAESSSETSSVESSSEEAIYASKINVNACPTEAYVGQTIDFEESVVVEPANATWEIVSSDEAIARVDGHSVTFYDPGIVTLTIQSGTKKRNVKVTVASEEAVKVRAFFSNFEYNYHGAAYNYGGKRPTMISELYHTTNYFYMPQSGGDPAFGLIALKDGQLYFIEDFDGETVTIKPGAQGPASNLPYYYYQMNPFDEIDVTEIVDGVDEDGIFNDTLVYKSPTTKDSNGKYPAYYIFAGTACGFNNDELYSGIEFRFVIDEEDEEGNPTTVYADVYSEGEDVGIRLVWDMVGSANNEVLDDYCVNGDLPAAIDPAALREGAASLSAANSYKVDVLSQVVSADGTVQQTIFDAEVYYDGTTMYAADATGLQALIKQKDGVWYNIVRDSEVDEEENITYLDSYTATALDDGFALESLKANLTAADVNGTEYSNEQEITSGQYKGMTGYAFAAGYEPEDNPAGYNNATMFDASINLIPQIAGIAATMETVGYTSENRAADPANFIGASVFFADVYMYANTTGLAVEMARRVYNDDYSAILGEYTLEMAFSGYDTTEVPTIDESLIKYPEVVEG
ncbi:MAG: hypothetical protein K5694_05805 [Bacilli bacterium]|nr:hypothetical protein [Bacilli bacterium]